jgi:hypothetical protein
MTLPLSSCGGTDPACCSGNGTPDALMRPGSVKEVHVCVEHAVELFLMQDEQMIEAFTPHASQKPFTDGIGSWGVIRYCENLDVTCVCEPCEAYPKLAIMITNKVLRSLAKGRGFPKLLCGPRVGRTSCDADVDHLPRVQFDDEEGIERPEKHVGDREKVAGPRLSGSAQHESVRRFSSSVLVALQCEPVACMSGSCVC